MIGRLHDDALRQIARELQASPREIEVFLPQFRGMLKCRRSRAALTRGVYQPSLIVLGFAAELNYGK